jgi:hypothetical protein
MYDGPLHTVIGADRFVCGGPSNANSMANNRSIIAFGRLLQLLPFGFENAEEERIPPATLEELVLA